MSYSPDLTTAAVKMVLSLLVVLALLWGLYRWARHALPGGGKGSMIKVLASHYLGTKKSIAIVQVPGQILVLGIGAEQINLLSRIDDPEVVAEMAFPANPANRAGGFRQQLQRMTSSLRHPGVSAAPEEKDKAH